MAKWTLLGIVIISIVIACDAIQKFVLKNPAVYFILFLFFYIEPMHCNEHNIFKLIFKFWIYSAVDIEWDMEILA